MGFGNLTIPSEVQRHIMIQLMSGNDIEVRYVDGEFIIVSSRKSIKRFGDDGKERKVYPLNRSYYGLYVPAGLWREMNNFSTNSLALEFGSIHFDEADYIYDYDEFIKMKANGKI